MTVHGDAEDRFAETMAVLGKSLETGDNVGGAFAGNGTLAEAMSGFAHVCGQPDGPPTLPPFMLADGVAAAKFSLQR